MGPGPAPHRRHVALFPAPLTYVSPNAVRQYHSQMKAPRGHGRAAGPWLLLGVARGVLGAATQSVAPTTAPVAPVLEKRAEVLTERPDFFAWVSGFDTSCV